MTPSTAPHSGTNESGSRRGRVRAVTSIEDLARLEELEDAYDVAAYRAAQADDDGTRIPLDELIDEVRRPRDLPR